MYSGSNGEKNNEGVDATKVYTKGNPEASVRLVEYSDFQCPACGAWHPIIKEVLSNVQEDVVFEYKHFPLPMHGFAEAAARAAEAAGQQGKFYEYHDLLFENQSIWSTSGNPTSMFIKYAEELGLDIDTFKRQMKSSLLVDKIANDVKEGHELGITGTPTFFINGERVVFGPNMTTGEAVNQLYQQISNAANPEVQFELNLPNLPENTN